MDYTEEDLMKIKQLVGTTDIDNIRVGIQIAKGLGVSVEELIELFTIDDVIEYDTFGPNYFRLEAFDHTNPGRTKSMAFETYKRYAYGDIKQLLNE